MALLALGLMTSQSEDMDSAFPLLTSRLPWQQNYSIAHPKHPMSQPQTCFQTIPPSAKSDFLPSSCKGLSERTIFT